MAEISWTVTTAKGSLTTTKVLDLKAAGNLAIKLGEHALYAKLGGIASTTGGGTYDTVLGYTEVYDPGTKFNPATGVYTVSAAGTYLVMGSIQITGTATQGLQLDAYDGSTSHPMGVSWTNASGEGGVSGAAIVNFAGAGTLVMRASNSLAAGLAFAFGQLTILRIGD